MLKKILTALLITAILLTMVPIVSFAYGNTYYATGIYNVGTCGAGNGDIIQVSGTVTLTGTNNSGIQICCTSSSNITLDNLHVSLQETNIWDKCALSFESSTTSTITLVGNNVIKSGGNEPGIKVLSGATLTIGGSGSLLAKGGQGAAGIGSDSKVHSSGTVIITSGNITAEGGDYGGAGIGGGRQGGNGRLDILGGTVTAQGGYLGAGIGGGGAYEDDFIVGAGGTINISGGTVTAIGSRGAGIGTGSNMSNSSSVLLSSGTTINISGGTVDATGGRGGAGIGTGKESPSDCTINISGGVVHAKSTVLKYAGDESSWYAAGIGGGYSSAALSVNITGGEVYAARSGYATSYGCSYDIGSGYDGTGSTVSIRGAAAVFLQDHMIENLSTSHTYVSNQTITDNSAYGYTHFPSDWSGTAYGYLVRYSVYFNGNGHDGGSVPSRMYYYLSDTERKIPEPAAPTVPTRTGYTLNGWYTNMACTGTAWNFTNNQVNSNMTLYAKWTPIHYPITYNNEYGAANINPVSYTIADTPLALSDLTGRTGYTFDGWYDNAELSGSAVVLIPLGSTGNKEYWGKWSPTDYSIRYNDVNGAVNTNPASYTIEDSDIMLSDLSLTGYVFDGWYDNAELSGSKVVSIPSGSTGDREYWAKWTPINYDIVYNDVNGAANTNPAGYTIADTPVTLSGLSGRTGYMFDGWYDNAELFGSAVASILSGSTGGREYWAKWTPIDYAIRYNNVNGTVNTNPASYTADDSDIVLSDLSLTGYVFEGWYDNAELSGSAVASILSGSTGDREYWAKWTPINYAVTYNDVHGAANTNPASYTIADTPVALSELTGRTGYTFNGWYYNAAFAGSAVSTIPSGSTEDREYWAKWRPLKYDITYYLDGGTNGPNPVSYTIEDTIVLEDPSKTSYTFSGWYLDETFENQITKIEHYKGDIVLYAKWAVQDSAPTASPSAPAPAASPKPDTSPLPQGKVDAQIVMKDTETGTVTVEVNAADLPEGTVSIKTPSGEVIKIGGQKTVRLVLSQGDMDENSSVLLTALNDEGQPLASFELKAAGDTFDMPSATSTWNGIWPVLMWVLIGLIGAGLVSAAVYIILRKKPAIHDER